jgi:ESX secretion system protein EccE
MRAAAVGATIRVQSPRPQAWGPVLRHGATVSIAPPGAGLPPPGTLDAPVLIVDDRPTEVGGLGDAGPWQCRLDVRALMSPPDVGAVAHADVLVLGQISAAIADALAATMGLSMSLTGQLAGLGPGSVALVARGTIVYVSLDPSQAEAQLLAQGAR